MSVQVLTHLADFDGKACHQCKVGLPPVEGLKRWPPYVRVGLVVTAYVAPVSYPVGEHDSNALCDAAKGAK